jgi:predicted GNAT superfamily acetyltransferase
MTKEEIKIREVSSVEDLSECVRLQREVFALPDLEISPVRHLIVTKSAGGFILGAFTAENKLVGFVLSVPAFRGAERSLYSHMTAVAADFQNMHIGARLKWAQRERALNENVSFIKWTFQPIQARNAFFNLERLGVEIKSYAANFYGTDYSTVGARARKLGIDSDRLFAEWNLQGEKVVALSKGEKFTKVGEAVKKIEIPNDWNALVEKNPQKAIAEQRRIKEEFQAAFAQNLICRRFERDAKHPKYLLYKN